MVSVQGQHFSGHRCPARQGQVRVRGRGPQDVRGQLGAAQHVPPVHGPARLRRSQPQLGGSHVASYLDCRWRRPCPRHGLRPDVVAERQARGEAGDIAGEPQGCRDRGGCQCRRPGEANHHHPDGQQAG